MDGSGMMLYEHLGQTVAEGKQGSSDGFACFDSMLVFLDSHFWLQSASFFSHLLR